MKNLEPCYADLEKVWVGARTHSFALGMLFSGETQPQLPPWRDGDTINLRLEDGEIHVRHVDTQQRTHTASARLPEYFAHDKSDVPRPSLDRHPKLEGSIEDEQGDELPSDHMWCVLQHYAHN